MSLLYEDLARARRQDLLAEAERARLTRQALNARRERRRTVRRVALLTRRLLAAVVVR